MVEEHWTGERVNSLAMNYVLSLCSKGTQALCAKDALLSSTCSVCCFRAYGAPADVALRPVASQR